MRRSVHWTVHYSCQTAPSPTFNPRWLVGYRRPIWIAVVVGSRLFNSLSYSLEETARGVLGQS